MINEGNYPAVDSLNELPDVLERSKNELLNALERSSNFTEEQKIDIRNTIRDNSNIVRRLVVRRYETSKALRFINAYIRSRRKKEELKQEEGHQESENKCPICLDELTESNMALLCDINHPFHIHCIQDLILSDLPMHCPCCMKPFNTNDLDFN